MMASERQVAANRRNARKSTGPRSAAGKKRASRNAFRHGLTSTLISIPERVKRIEKLARKIAGTAEDMITLQCARTAAEAEFQLAHIRQARRGLIDRILVFGELDLPRPVFPGRFPLYLVDAMANFDAVPSPHDAEAMMPVQTVSREAEAIRRALPELLKLDRYERRAWTRKARSLRTVVRRNAQILQNEANL